MALILASGSPRRRELLQMLGVQDLVIMPAVGAEHPPEGASPAKTVEALAKAKAGEIYDLLSGGCRVRSQDTVVAADTVVELDGKLLGKPKNRGDARRMLLSLSGREHRVYTGVCVISRDGETVTAVEVTSVRFRDMSSSEIEAYIDTGEPMDKAGAYGAQGLGSLFVEGIDGDFFNVMGLPLCRLSKMLKKLGVDLI